MTTNIDCIIELHFTHELHLPKHSARTDIIHLYNTNQKITGKYASLLSLVVSL